jgi:putative hydrolase
MTDPNIFDELMKLLNQPGPVNWALAAQIADHVTSGQQPIDPWVAEEYIDLVRLAQMRVSESTGLDAGPIVDVIPLDAAEWATRNLRSFRYLIEPIAEKLANAPSSGPMDAVLRPLAPALLGMQMGAIVGALSQRVLGQFDVGLPTADAGDLYFVVPNIEQFATENQLDNRQVRLWVALHEVTHQLQLARPWVRPHFQTLIDRYIASVEVDPSAFGSGIEDFNSPERIQEMLEEGGGLPSFLSGPNQSAQLEDIQAFMALIEGYGDYMMDTAAHDLLPDLSAMRSAMNERRADPEQADVLGSVLGLEDKHAQYDVGSRFCIEVEQRWGPNSLRRLWEGPENLPTMPELRDATGWAARVLLDDPFADE